MESTQQCEIENWTWGEAKEITDPKMIEVIQEFTYDTQSILQREARSKKKWPNGQVKFLLNAAQEKKADRPFRDSYYQMKYSIQRKREFDHCLEKMLKSQGLEPKKEVKEVGEGEPEPVDEEWDHSPVVMETPHVPMAPEDYWEDEKQEPGPSTSLPKEGVKAAVDEDDEDYGITITYSNPKLHVYQMLWGKLYEKPVKEASHR